MAGVVGSWRITWTDSWGEDDLDLVGRAAIVFDRRNAGSIQVGALHAEVDYRPDRSGGLPRADFTWSGYDDMDPVSGRGWVEVDGDSLRGKLFMHLRDDVEFSAVRDQTEK